ncbi:MAG: hypothetical protein GX442_25635 [Candidatus Riflebacteria bacterium]|nr:hypothetical protein [Candidatus Riflebacteria bacterium]
MIRGQTRWQVALLTFVCLLSMLPGAAADGLDGTHRFDEAFREWAKQVPPRFEAPADPIDESCGTRVSDPADHSGKAVSAPEDGSDLTGHRAGASAHDAGTGRHGAADRPAGDPGNATPDRALGEAPRPVTSGAVTSDSRPAPTPARRSRPRRTAEKIGDVVPFWTANLASNTFDRLEATLVAVGSHSRLYVETGRDVPAATLQRLQREFDGRLVPTVRALCGAEKVPGIDGDARLTLLLLDIRDGVTASSGPYVAGYFYPGDQYPEGQLPPNVPGHSNQRDMLYLDIAQGDPDRPAFLGVMAHELQHLIHFHHDPTETTWLNEACSQAAARACGTVSPRQIAAFIADPDNSLVGWHDENPLANYGQATLWMAWLLDRVAAAGSAASPSAGNPASTTACSSADPTTVAPASGTTGGLAPALGAVSTLATRRPGRSDPDGGLLRELVADPRHGVESLAPALAARGLSMQSLFTDFCVALTWNDGALGSGTLVLPADFAGVKVPPVLTAQALPADLTGDLHLWSGEAVRLDMRTARRHLRLDLTAEIRVLGDDLSGLAMLLCWEQNGRPVAGHLGKVPLVPAAYAGIQTGRIDLEVPDGVDALSVMLVSWVPTSVPDFLYARQKALWYRLQAKDSGDPRSPAPVAAAPRAPATRAPTAPKTTDGAGGAVVASIAANGSPSASETDAAAAGPLSASTTDRGGALPDDLVAPWFAAAAALDGTTDPEQRLALGDRLAGLERQLAHTVARRMDEGQDPDVTTLEALATEAAGHVPAAARRLQAALAAQIRAARLQERL